MSKKSAYNETCTKLLRFHQFFFNTPLCVPSLQPYVHPGKRQTGMSLRHSLEKRFASQAETGWTFMLMEYRLLFIYAGEIYFYLVYIDYCTVQNGARNEWFKFLNLFYQNKLKQIWTSCLKWFVRHWGLTQLSKWMDWTAYAVSTGWHEKDLSLHRKDARKV